MKPPKYKTPKRIPENKWEWFGYGAHLCVGPWCRFHMATLVGGYMVSTVGDYRPPHASEKDCPAMREIGCNRMFETFVFRASPSKATRCKIVDCLCQMPALESFSEIYSLAANTAGDATKNHRKACELAATGKL